MWLRGLSLLLCAAATVAQERRAPQLRPAEIELVEVSVRRDATVVTIDGQLKNRGERPAKKLRIFIDFRDADGKVISTQRGGIEQESLEAEGESEFHAQVPDQVRAVDVQFRYEDGSGRDLKGINAGPFAIE